MIVEYNIDDKEKRKHYVNAIDRSRTCRYIMSCSTKWCWIWKQCICYIKNCANKRMPVSKLWMICDVPSSTCRWFACFWFDVFFLFIAVTFWRLSPISIWARGTLDGTDWTDIMSLPLCFNILLHSSVILSQFRCWLSNCLIFTNLQASKEECASGWLKTGRVRPQKSPLVETCDGSSCPSGTVEQNPTVDRMCSYEFCPKVSNFGSVFYY